MRDLIAGIDYSYTCPGIAIGYCGDPAPVLYYATYKKKNLPTDSFLHPTTLTEKYDWNGRTDQISEWALDIVKDCSYVLIEGYSYGSVAGRVFEIAENTGLLKYKLWKSSIRYNVAAPSEVKKSATGKGNADKNQMYAAFQQSFKDRDLSNHVADPMKIKSPIGDVVDAAWIWKLACKQHQFNADIC